MVTVFDPKYHCEFWRPITAIRNGDEDITRPLTAMQLGNRWAPLPGIRSTPTLVRRRLCRGRDAGRPRYGDGG
jgi:hypothetical protein